MDLGANLEHEARHAADPVLLVCFSPSIFLIPLLFLEKKRTLQTINDAFSGEERDRSRGMMGEYDVVVTTYGVLCADFDPDLEHQTAGLFSVEFHRVVLDEAHIIKSKASLTARGLRSAPLPCYFCLLACLSNIWNCFSFLS